MMVVEIGRQFQQQGKREQQDNKQSSKNVF